MPGGFAARTDSIHLCDSSVGLMNWSFHVRQSGNGSVFDPGVSAVQNMADFGRLTTRWRCPGVRSQVHPSKEEGNSMAYASLLSLAMIIVAVCLIILAGKKIKSDRRVLARYFLGSCCNLSFFTESTKDGAKTLLNRHRVSLPRRSAFIKT